MPSRLANIEKINRQAVSQAINRINSQRQKDLEQLAEALRRRLIAPFCRKYGLQFGARMGDCLFITPGNDAKVNPDKIDKALRDVLTDRKANEPTLRNHFGPGFVPAYLRIARILDVMPDEMSCIGEWIEDFADRRQR